MQIFLYLCTVFWQMESVLSHISKNQVKFIRSLQQKKVRDEEGLFVAEGDKCIGELIHHFELVTLVQSGVESGKFKVESKLDSGKFNSYIATEQELSQISSLKTPQGSLAVFRQKSDKLSTTEPDDSSKLSTLNFKLEQALVLALDGIQDPGNLGTIIRTADWFGITDVYCSKDTADCYNPKVVQATMGALARVNIHYVDLVESLKFIVESLKFPLYGTLLDGRNIYEEGAISDPTCGIIIMGNEGNGISAEVREFITHPLYIPSYTPNTHIESLNVAVATAITLAEFRRQSQLK